MFCHKCGTEIPSADASFCINCREPLLKIQPPGGTPANSESENRQSNPSSINLAFGDDDEALKMSDPIDFLMQESEENEQKQEAPDRYKEEFQNGFDDEIQDEIQDRTPEGVQNGYQDNAPDENPDGDRENIPYGIQGGYQDKIPDEMQEGYPDKTPDENQEGYSDKTPVENREGYPDKTPDEIQDGYPYNTPDEDQGGDRDAIPDTIPDKFQGGYRENTPDESQSGGRDTIPDRVPDKVQDGYQDKSPNEVQEGHREEIAASHGEGYGDNTQDQTAPGRSPMKESTDKIKSTESGKPHPLFTGYSAGSSMNIERTNSAPSKQAVGTIARKQDEKKMPPVLQVTGTEDPNRGENIIATAKIKVDEPKSVANPELKFEPPTMRPGNLKTPSDPTNLDINKIRRSSGIAYLSGSSLTLAGGPKIAPGERIQIGESTYEVKLKPKNRNELYALIGSVAISILLTLYFLGAFSSSQYGTLVGLLVGSDSRPLPSQEVRIKETGDKFTTNSAGLFIFEHLTEGIYTVEYLDDDEVVGEERITVLAGKTSTLRLSKNSSGSRSEIQTKPAARRKSENVVTVASSSNEPDASKKKGARSHKTQSPADGGQGLS